MIFRRLNTAIILATLFLSATLRAQPANSTATTKLLLNARALSWTDVPGDVQLALKTMAGADTAVRVETSTAEGENIYRGSFERDGKPMEVLLKADGSVYSPNNRVAWNEV